MAAGNDLRNLHPLPVGVLSARRNRLSGCHVGAAQEANQMLTRPYRAPYIVLDNV